jgi:hypothetical protein
MVVIYPEVVVINSVRIYILRLQFVVGSILLEAGCKIWKIINPKLDINPIRICAI